MNYKPYNALGQHMNSAFSIYTKGKNKLVKFPLRLYHYVERIMAYPLTGTHVCTRTSSIIFYWSIISLYFSRIESLLISPLDSVIISSAVVFLFCCSFLR